MSSNSMEAKITISSIGLAIPGTSLGINALSGTYLQIRKNPKAPILTYAIKSTLDISGNSGTLIMGHAASSWFPVSEEAFSKLQIDNLKGKGYFADVEVSSTLAGSGTTDIKFSLISKNGNSDVVFEKYNLKSKEFQLDSTKIREQIFLLPIKK